MVKTKKTSTKKLKMEKVKMEPKTPKKIKVEPPGAPNKLIKVELEPPGAPNKFKMEKVKMETKTPKKIKVELKPPGAPKKPKIEVKVEPSDSIKRKIEFDDDSANLYNNVYAIKLFKAVRLLDKRRIAEKLKKKSQVKK